MTRIVSPDILALAIGDLPDPTTHMPDVGEEAAIAQVNFRLEALGVDEPILLSQIPSTRLAEDMQYA